MSAPRGLARRLVPAGLDAHALACLVLSMLLGVGGQVLLKIAAADLAHLQTGLGEPLRLVGAVLGSPRLLAGLALYGSGTFFWLLALSRAELAVIYPYTALNYLLVLLPSALVLRERIGAWRLAGVALIALGVGLHALSLRNGSRAPARAAPPRDPDPTAREVSP